jgi:hypothetical protein
VSQITVKEAVAKAKAHLLELYADDAPQVLALEEIEKVESGTKQLWAVTLGFHRRRDVSVSRDPSAVSFFQPPTSKVEHRVYKTVMIDANTGDFVKMDMRQVS